METMLAHNYQQFYNQVKSVIPQSRLVTDSLRTLVYGTDASFYRLVPKIVVEIDDEAELVAVVNAAQQYNTPITFRAAGTSLSGQAITDSVLVRLGADRWRAHQILENGALIRLQPGVVGSAANRYLLPYQRKIGPDPSSINSAKIGGIAANNASGNCCGIAQNSYQTLDCLRVVLADGAVLETGDKNSREKFRQTHKDFLRQLSDLAVTTRANNELTKRIQHKYRIKNTMGYSLNALIDFTDPIDILAHLMIGSEGTLGFISEITYKTVVEHQHKASALVCFDDIKTACQAVAKLKTQSVSAAELMDRRALRSVENKTGMPAYLKDLSGSAAALLIETRAESATMLAQQTAKIEQTVNSIATVYPAEFTDVPEQYNALWHIRKGLFPAVGAVRETGTTVIIEDVAFDVSNLAQGALGLQALFRKYGYIEAIIFGHALDGNLHFVFTQDFSVVEEVERYKLFMDEVCDMVINKYDGSLKAEHSTGRNMAPFLEMEWGEQAYQLMQQIKLLFDPQNILNPGVILNDNSKIHLENLKPLYRVNPLVDKCIECGFCEPMCPSRSLSLTPRQRIAGLREINRLNDLSNQSAAELAKLFDYQGIDTCAGDGLCSIQCPVGIDTGKMMKYLRGQRAGRFANQVADSVVKHYGLLEKASRFSLNSANLLHGLLGTQTMNGLCTGMRKISGDRIPLWNKYMPKGSTPVNRKTSNESSQNNVVYFPSCASRMMGAARGDEKSEALHVVVERLLEKAGFNIIIPDQLEGKCCGMPFESKGLNRQASLMLENLQAVLLEASENGKYPIIYDTSPCSFRTRNNSNLRIYDLVEFIHENVIDNLNITLQEKTVAVHSTCSSMKMGLDAKLKEIAQRCAKRVVVPDDISCCGWAGDKGFVLPELNASATHLLKENLPADCSEGYSTSRTCEIGLSLHSDRYYRSIVYLLDESSIPK